MHDRRAVSTVIRFGPFALDVRTGELRKGPTHLKVPDQSIEILRALLERPGDLVTREELRRRLWPADTFVDFDHGLNAALRRLRGALGDSADGPRFVETLPRRGYRFIGLVDHEHATEGVGGPRRDAHTGSLGSEAAARRATEMYSSLWQRALDDQERVWKAYHAKAEPDREVDYQTVCSCLVCRIRRAFSRTLRPKFKGLLAAG
jgi:DNA-binding winged helix-turn-helix (wHTH) protein